MKLNDAFNALRELAQEHQPTFGDVDMQTPWSEARPCVGDWSDLANLGMVVTGDGIGNRTGLYFFTTPDGEIVYIGKATTNNLHHRIWDHLRRPEVLEDGRRMFPRHIFGGHAEAEPHEDDVLNGRLRLGIAALSNPEFVTLAEKHLQNLYKKQHGRLPAFNKRVG